MLKRLLGAVFLTLLAHSEVFAQDHAQPSDTFPASLGYAFLAAVTAAGGVLSGAVAKLHLASTKKDKLHQEALDAARAECRVELREAQDALSQEKTERREEAEKLLREQKDTLREVLLTANSVSSSLTKNSEATTQLSALISTLEASIVRLEKLLGRRAGGAKPGE